MKKVILLLLFLLQNPAVYAQINWGDYSQSFSGGTMADPSTVALIVAVHKANDSFRETNANHIFDLLAKDASLDSAFRRLGPATMVNRSTFDTAPAHFFLHGVNPNNAISYEFRVTDSPTNQILIPWRDVDQFTDSTLVKDSGLPEMAYLGGYKAPVGHTLIVTIRKKEGPRMIAYGLINWSPIKPTIANVYTSDNLDAFFRKLQYPWDRENDQKPTNLTVSSLKLPTTNTNLILLLNATIYHKEQVQYEIVRDGQVVRPWASNEYDNSFIWIKNYPPGTYQLNIRYTVQPQHVTTYSFEIVPAWYQTQRFKLMVGLVVVACLGALLFLVLFIRQKQKSRRELANKTKLQLELKAIYAQLNPHFVFNALSSIQGLMNKQDIQGANNYLSNFAKLMRESLTNSNKEDVPLHEEIQVLETYLSLERLRFGFQYQIVVDDSINRYDTNIPALLVQPLVENAVKHGISGLQEAGLIDIRFDKTDGAMVVHIADNGRGFPAQESTNGFGLKLTRDRIKLLNELNPAQPIQLEINPRQPTGTSVILRFTHWFV